MKTQEKQELMISIKLILLSMPSLMVYCCANNLHGNEVMYRPKSRKNGIILLDRKKPIRMMKQNQPSHENSSTKKHSKERRGTQGERKIVKNPGKESGSPTSSTKHRRRSTNGPNERKKDPHTVDSFKHSGHTQDNRNQGNSDKRWYQLSSQNSNENRFYTINIFNENAKLYILANEDRVKEINRNNPAGKVNSNNHKPNKRSPKGKGNFKKFSKGTKDGKGHQHSYENRKDNIYGKGQLHHHKRSFKGKNHYNHHHQRGKGEGRSKKKRPCNKKVVHKYYHNKGEGKGNWILKKTKRTRVYHRPNNRKRPSLAMKEDRVSGNRNVYSQVNHRRYNAPNSNIEEDLLVSKKNETCSGSGCVKVSKLKNDTNSVSRLKNSSTKEYAYEYNETSTRMTSKSPTKKVPSKRAQDYIATKAMKKSGKPPKN